MPRVEGDEYAQITNQGGSAVNLAGWRLDAGDPGQDFWFPGYELQTGQSCRVYTNEYRPDTFGFSSIFVQYSRSTQANAAISSIPTA